MTRPLPVPPRLAEAVLGAAIRHQDRRDGVLGDLREEHAALAARRGRRAAGRWYWRQAFSLFLTFALTRPPRTHGERSMDSLDAVTRGASTGSWPGGLLRDIRYAWRSVLQRPATSATIIVALALGLAANGVIFSLADAIVLRPFRFPGIGRLATVVSEPKQPLFDRDSVAPADFLEWRREADVFEHLSAVEWWDVNVTGGDRPEALAGVRVSPGFFDAVGVHPFLGRGFLASEGTAGSNRRVVISHSLWRSRYDGDPGIVGRTVDLGGETHEIVGVAPRGFELPLGVQAWAPLVFDEQAARERGRGWLMVVGRLADGVTFDQAQRRMEAIVARQAREHPDTNKDRAVTVLTFTHGMGDPGAGAFVAIWQAAALLLLLIGCANVANLLLVRGAERQREMALRLALGASRFQVAMQMLVEGALLATAGVAVALPLAYAGVRATRLSFPASIQRWVPGWDHLHLQFSTFAVMAALAGVATLLSALVPALQSARAATAEGLQRGGRTTTGGRGWMRAVFGAAQIALAITLVTASGMAIQSARRATEGPLGFEPEGVLTASAVLPDATYEDAQRRRQFAARVVEELAKSPAIVRSGITSTLPYGGSNTSRALRIEGSVQALAEARTVDFRRVSPDYLGTLRVPLLAGRAIGPGDDGRALPVALVSRSLADRYWPGQDPIGRRFRLGQDETLLTVVGVAGEVSNDWFLREARPTVYRPLAQDPPYAVAIVARVAGDPLSLAGVMRRAVAAADPDLPLNNLRTMPVVIREHATGIRYAADALGIMGGVGLFLAVLGVYSLVSFATARRTQEIGIRTALGATPSDVVRLTLAGGARIAAVGVTIGLVLALAVGRAMEGLLFRTVSLSVPLTVGVALCLGAVALAACIQPARRATAVDPTIALKAE